MFSKFSRSWELLQYTFGLLKQEKKLLVFPLLSAIASILVLVSFLPFAPESLEAAAEAEQISTQGEMVWLFWLYVAEYFVIFFFNSALVSVVLDRLNGRPAGIASGLNHAFARIVPIFGYAMIAATVGVILRLISERVGFIGQIVVGFMGAAWSIACFLTVPILVSKDIGPVDAIRQSMSMLKRTWGENLAANAGLGLAFFGIYLLMTGVLVAIMMSGMLSDGAIAIAIGLFVFALMMVALIHTTLQGIFSGVLFHFATNCAENDSHPAGLLGDSFSRKD